MAFIYFSDLVVASKNKYIFNRYFRLRFGLVNAIDDILILSMFVRCVWRQFLILNDNELISNLLYQI